jgi:predicted flap endonuclease-1-like 5' DNA nuclease
MFRKFRLKWILIAAVLVVWWWLSKQDEELESVPEQVILDKDIEKKEEEIISPSEKKRESIPVKLEVDDLTKITGIGPKINAALHAAGINTFDQLAESNEDALEQVLNQAGIRAGNYNSWIEQAKNEV